MKTIIAVIITAVVTWFIADLVHGVRTGADRKWMISAMKAPGGMALHEIQEDMEAKRIDLAKAKLEAFRKTWQRFSSGPDSCSGAGIGDIMVIFSTVRADPMQ